ncbi:MAG: Coenzyme F420 hydrogenase/dehydrogenase, beta subunit C-terminal domain [Sodaliphilus sp.]
MTEICPSDRCTGCAACASVCHKSAISMTEDKLFGHYKPIIDLNVCVDCGLCKKICPVLNVKCLHYPLTAYAAWSKDKEDYHTSSSGGASSVISQYTIEKGGVVYGVAFDDDLIPKHIRIEGKNQLFRIKGSKYVQSKIEPNILSQVKKDVKAGRLVTFFGTPCQNAGLRNVINRGFSNLILVDLICHGVPSYKMFREHITGLVDISRVQNISFRPKEGFGITMYDSNQDVLYFKNVQNDKFMLGFLKSLFYNEACYNCRYASAERISDITIGDFWGLGKLNIHEKHDDGVSVILLNSDKGLSFFNSIKGRFYHEERQISEAILGNKQLRKHSAKPFGYSLFRCLYPNYGFKISYLSAFALQDKLYKLLFWLLSKI